MKSKHEKLVSESETYKSITRQQTKKFRFSDG